MPTLVQFGAGNIGRGFLAPLFTAAGWEVVFIDVAPAVVAGLNARRSFTVTEVSAAGARAVAVAPVRAVDGRDLAAVAGAVAAADLVATAVGLGALPHIAPGIAAGLERRGRPLDVLVCENGARAAEQLAAAVAGRLPAERRAALAALLGCVRTSIGRMIPADPAGGLDIRVEPYCHLPCERAAFRGPVPAVPGLEPRDDFDLVLRQKLYLHNLTHAGLAYGGHLRGLATIPACVADPALAAAARAAGAEAAEALARAHGRDEPARAAIRGECLAMLDDLMVRYANPALNDPVARVARDPWRKLAADDRLLGAARLCREQGVACPAIIALIAAAVRYTAVADEPRAAEWNALAPTARLAAASGLSATEPIMKAAEKAVRQQEAAQRMRAAGLVLREDDAAAIEIADFGLGRYAEIGLAIHVYVNTARCCAKELMMLPGQICPEHRHPPVDGDPGKEETFRVRAGEVFLFVPPSRPGQADPGAADRLLPADKRGTVTALRCVHLRPGDQFTLVPDTLHWFAAGPDGAVVSEFSTRSRDDADIFTDAAIVRCPAE